MNDVMFYTIRGRQEREYRAYLRSVLFEEQNGQCFYCGESMWPPEEDVRGAPSRVRMATLEHKHPVTHGGEDRVDNGVCSCQECNTHKGAIPHEEFVAIRQLGVAWFLFANAYDRAIRDGVEYVDLEEAMYFRNWSKSTKALRDTARFRRRTIGQQERMRTARMTNLLRRHRPFVYV